MVLKNARWLPVKTESILLGLSVITLQLKALTTEPKGLWRTGWFFFHISPMETEPELAGSKLTPRQSEPRQTEFGPDWPNLEKESTFARVSVKYPPLTLSTAVTSLQGSVTSTSLWLRPEEPKGLEWMQRQQATHTFAYIVQQSGSLISDSNCIFILYHTLVMKQFFLVFRRKTRMKQEILLQHTAECKLKLFINVIYFSYNKTQINVILPWFWKYQAILLAGETHSGGVNDRHESFDVWCDDPVEKLLVVVLEPHQKHIPDKGVRTSRVSF